jgi:hypothetical protein
MYKNIHVLCATILGLALDIDEDIEDVTINVRYNSKAMLFDVDVLQGRDNNCFTVDLTGKNAADRLENIEKMLRDIVLGGDY